MYRFCNLLTGLMLVMLLAGCAGNSSQEQGRGSSPAYSTGPYIGVGGGFQH